MKWTETDYTSA